VTAQGRRTRRRPDGIAEVGRNAGRDFGGEAGFTRAAGPGQRYETIVEE